MSAKFNSMDEAAARLRDNTPLTEDEVRALFPWVLQPLNLFLPRVQMDLALLQIAAINQFNKTSGKLTKAAIFVGCAQVAVGLIAIVIALLR